MCSASLSLVVEDGPYTGQSTRMSMISSKSIIELGRRRANSRAERERGVKKVRREEQDKGTLGLLKESPNLRSALHSTAQCTAIDLGRWKESGSQFELISSIE